LELSGGGGLKALYFEVAYGGRAGNVGQSDMGPVIP
jgi:hypothetical protein